MDTGRQAAGDQVKCSDRYGMQNAKRLRNGQRISLSVDGVPLGRFLLQTLSLRNAAASAEIAKIRARLPGRAVK